MTAPPLIEGAFYTAGTFIFQLLSVEEPMRYICLRDWERHWLSELPSGWPVGTLDVWPPTRDDDWRLIPESGPLFTECCRQVALYALLPCQEG